MKVLKDKKWIIKGIITHITGIMTTDPDIKTGNSSILSNSQKK
jgi:hypothetical protein